MAEIPTDHRQLWQNLSRALGTELRDLQSIRGASGLDHPVQAVCVDDKTKRIIVISAESNPRTAALIQGDIQTTMPDVNVIVARPIIVDLGVIVRRVFPSAASATITPSQIAQYMKGLEKLPEAKKNAIIERGLYFAAGPMLQAFKRVPLPALTQLVGIFQQAAVFDWQDILDRFARPGDSSPISFAKLYEIDNLAVDRAHGVCPLPLYEFTERDWDLFLQERSVDEVQSRLKELDILQYFYPPADQVALGLAERGIRGKDAIIELVQSSPTIGHPLSPSELVPKATQIPDLIDVLREQGYVAEVEQQIEVTPAGSSARMTIKTRPRESLLSKLINRFQLNANVNLSATTKDFTSSR